MKKPVLKILIAVAVVALYVISAVPVGLFLYTLKSDLGINVFNKTGYHGFKTCLEQQISDIGETGSTALQKSEMKNEAVEIAQ